MSLRKWILLSVLFSMIVGCGGPWSSGDRVLVSKMAYDNGLTGPHRYDVVVFKFPVNPVKNGTPTNYIKRLLGLPGELLAVFFGRVYHSTPAEAPFHDTPKDPKELWQFQYMHQKDPDSVASFEKGEFEILRKPPHVMLAMRRIVYDNDYQATDLKGKLDRWAPEAKSGWKTDSETGFAHDGKAGEQVDWLHYQHLVRPDKLMPGDAKEKPKLITDSMAYNNFIGKIPPGGRNAGAEPANHTPPHPNWVGDLMIECNVQVVEAKGEFCFELNKGVYRYQACWDIATGKCTLKSIDMEGNEKELAAETTSFKSPGNYLLRFANVDARLTVWVDRALPFGDGKEYPPPEVRAKGENISDELLAARRGPYHDPKDRFGDLKPASVGSKGANVKITHLRVWRDTYYTTTAEDGGDHGPLKMDWADPTMWEPLRKPNVLTMYVQRGHYLCMGDNSQASSDSRSWGTVPERLMLGRALVVYFPLDRIGVIR
jgi:signal peptidase I